MLDVEAPQDGQVDYISPDAMQFCKIEGITSQALAQDFLHGLKLSEKQLVLMPINDECDVEKAWGGTHWALLIYARLTNTFYLLDSLETHALRSVAGQAVRLLSAALEVRSFLPAPLRPPRCTTPSNFQTIFR
jgi:hypothetical protein